MADHDNKARFEMLENQYELLTYRRDSLLKEIKLVEEQMTKLLKELEEITKE